MQVGPFLSNALSASELLPERSKEAGGKARHCQDLRAGILLHQPQLLQTLGTEPSANRLRGFLNS